MELEIYKIINKTLNEILNKYIRLSFDSAALIYAKLSIKTRSIVLRIW